MFLLVSKLKMIRMQLNEVHGQVKKGNKKDMTMESNGFHNHYTLITMMQWTA